MTEAVIYVDHELEHIKLVQLEKNGPVYIRSIFGDELLLSSNDFCDLLAHWFDKIASDNLLKLVKNNTESELDQKNLETLKKRIQEYKERVGDV